MDKNFTFDGIVEQNINKHLSKFENEIKNILLGLDYETSIIFLEIFTQKLDKIDISKIKIDLK